MSMSSEYAAFIQRLNSAVSSAMQNEVCEESKTVIKQKMESVVYSYDATPQAMATRRGDSGGLSDEGNLEHKYSNNGSDHELTIENTAGFQGTQWSPDLITVVEQGLSNFNQPGARPVMQESQEELNNSVESILEGALRAKGF